MEYKLILLVFSASVLAKGSALPSGAIQRELSDDLFSSERRAMHERTAHNPDTHDQMRLMKRGLEASSGTQAEEMASQAEARQKTETDEDPARAEETEQLPEAAVDNAPDDSSRAVESEHNTRGVVTRRRVVPYIRSIRGPFKVTAMQPAVNGLDKIRKRCMCSFPSGRVHEFEVIGVEGPLPACGCGCCTPYPLFSLGCQPSCGDIGLFGGLGGFPGFGGFGGCHDCGAFDGCGCGGCGGCSGGCGGCGGGAVFGGCPGAWCGCGACGVPTIVQHVYDCCKKDSCRWAPRRKHHSKSRYNTRK